MTDNEDTICILNDDKILKEIKDDIKLLRQQLNKLDNSIDVIDKKCNTLKPEINRHSSNINILLTQIYEQHKKNITYFNIFKLSTFTLILVTLKKVL